MPKRTDRVPARLAMVAGVFLVWTPATHAQTQPPKPSARCVVAGAPQTLGDVLGRVAGSPRAEAIARELAASEALETQAAALPNPQLDLAMEDFAGTDNYANYGQSQTTLSVAQRLELGGRRARRTEVAQRETAVQRVRGERQTLRAAAVAKQATVALLAARARLAIRQDARRLAEDALTQAKRLAQSGAASIVEADRATMACATASLDLSAAERDVGVAEQRLAALWGDDAPAAACITGDLTLPSTLTREAARQRPPAVVMAEAEVDARKADVELARAEATPDVEVLAGVRHRTGPSDVSAVAGLGVEIPIFDRNNGNIAAAEQHLFAAQAQAAWARRQSESRAQQLRQTIAASRDRARRLQSEVIPAAERAHASLLRAWRGGAASSLDVVDARRTLIGFRLDRIDALVDLHRAATSLEDSLGVVSPHFEDISVAPSTPSQD